MTQDKILNWKAYIQDPERQHATKIRRLVEKAIHEFFEMREFIHVRTPTIVVSPGMETHIRPYQLSTGEYLATSPEFSMKKLLVGGLEKIFQICPAYRVEPKSPQHHPEFTLLEWYRAHASYEDIMKDFEELMEFLAIKITGSSQIRYCGNSIELKAPWTRLKVYDLFLEFAQIDIKKASTLDSMAEEAKKLGLSVDTSDTWDDLYFKIWLNFIENKLPHDRGVIVYHYPPSQAALSVLEQNSDGSFWAKRFEPYAGGLELGNAFEELCDPIEQRKRFEEDMNLREQIYGKSFPKNPIDEEFLSALEEGMPPSGGIAVGVDRLVMLMANQPNIDKTLWLNSYVKS